MGTRTFADVPPTAATIALNAYIYGYGGHSLVTPHHAIKQLWWTDERIDAKVTRDFIISKLRGEERSFLHKPLAFGEGLTDDTYLDWILERARRFFLILADIGVPDQIFGCIDDSWDDEDLPVSLETVRGLGLSYDDNEILNKKFYDTQFVYLLRELKQGSHIDYGANEHIPMDYANTNPPAVSLQVWDRVHFPGRPDDVYMRRKVSFAEKDVPRNIRDLFMRDVKKAQSLTHEHIARAWGTYTAKDAGYILSDFVGEHTLATFMSHRMPPQFLRIPLRDRPVMVYEWMHCLIDAIACLHSRGVAHSAIRPSNIIIDENNRIAFSDVGTIRVLQRNKKPQSKTEIFDYAAPETPAARTSQGAISSPLSPSFPLLVPQSKNAPSVSGSPSAWSHSSGGGNSTLSVSPRSRMTSPSLSRTNSVVTITATIGKDSTDAKTETGVRNFSRRAAGSFGQQSTSYLIPTTSQKPRSISSYADSVHSDPLRLADLPTFSPLQSDIFSLGGILLDIVTFAVKGRLDDFVKFRTTKIKPLKFPGAPKSAARTDTSFHYDPDKIFRWMDLLEEDAAGKAAEHPIFHGVPALLILIRSMMAQNPALRPSAVEVRDSLHEILVKRSFIDRPLCCTDREWDFVDLPFDENEPGLALTTTISATDVMRHALPDEPSIEPSPDIVHEPIFSINASEPLTAIPAVQLPARPNTALPSRSSSSWQGFGRKPQLRVSNTPITDQSMLEDVYEDGSVHDHGLQRKNSITSVVTTATARSRKARGWRFGFGRKQ